MSKETIQVEIPLQVIAEEYLKRAGGYQHFHAARHLNKQPHDFFQVKIQDRQVNGQLAFSFELTNGPHSIKEVILTLPQIFEQAEMLTEIFAEIRAEKAAKP